MKNETIQNESRSYVLTDSTSSAVRCLENLHQLGGDILEAIRSYNGGDGSDLEGEFLDINQDLENFLGKLIFYNVRQNLGIIPEESDNIREI